MRPLSIARRNVEGKRASVYVIRNCVDLCVADGDFCKRSIETAGLQVYGSGFYNGGASVYASWITTGIALILWITH